MNDVEPLPPLSPVPTPARAPQPPERFEFTGSGGEYFRIWIVNLLLTLLTFGIYSAWAKVRRMQYFYRHTRVAGSSFDYHGQPLAILKGRLIALGLFLCYSLSTEFAPLLALPVIIGLGLLLPWLLRSAFRFRLHNSSWRGLRFSFRGKLGESYVVFLLLGTLGIFTGFLWPLFHSRMKKYQHGNSWFGATQASFHATDGQFYGVYVRASLLSLAAFVVVILLMVMGASSLRELVPEGEDAAEKIGVAIAIAVFITLFLVWFLLAPYLMARLQNLIWSNTRLGEHRFLSEVPAGRLTWVMLGNLVAVILTLGLFMPWAAVRLARVRIEYMSLLPAGNLDEFVADQQQSVQALGEESAEVFDLDIGL
ncbi:MAG TPA: YjgN family protein [Solimonas sp.]|nr:YjgN family protein [Solimonas sp.]